MGFVRGAGLDAVANTTSTALMHAVDWLPTLLAATDGHDAASATLEARSTFKTLEDIDGISLWTALSSGKPSPRTELVYNIEPNGLGTTGMKCGAVRVGCHKLIKGAPGSGTYDPQPQPRPADAVPTFAPLADTTYHALEEADALVVKKTEFGVTSGGESGAYLFDLCSDPLEKTNLYNTSAVAAVQKTLEERLAHYHSLMVPALYKTQADDWRFAPQLHNGSWTWYGCEAD